MLQKKILLALVIVFLAVGALYAKDKAAEYLYLKSEKEGLCDKPKGDKFCGIEPGTKMTVLEEDGGWVKVSIEGWIEKKHTVADESELGGAGGGPDLELVKWGVKHLPKDIEKSRYNAEMELWVSMKNNTNKKIKAWRGMLTVKNSFGDVLFTTKLNVGKVPISPGKTEKTWFSWEDNPFIDGEVYDKLHSYTEDNLSITLTSIEIVQ